MLAILKERRQGSRVQTWEDLWNVIFPDSDPMAPGRSSKQNSILAPGWALVFRRVILDHVRLIHHLSSFYTPSSCS